MQSNLQKVERYFDQSALQFDALYDERRNLSFYINRLFRPVGYSLFAASQKHVATHKSGAYI